jgi:hypothetical protein
MRVIEIASGSHPTTPLAHSRSHRRPRGDDPVFVNEIVSTPCHTWPSAPVARRAVYPGRDGVRARLVAETDSSGGVSAEEHAAATRNTIANRATGLRAVLTARVYADRGRRTTRCV